MRSYALGAIYALSSAAIPAVIPVASLKDVAVDFKQAKKKFNGQKKVAIDVGDATLDIAVKIKSADFRSSAFNLILPGATITTGGAQVAPYEQAPIPTTPFTVTVSQAATFVEDGGVLDTTAGKWLTRVASAPATGQYAVTAGVYTFAAADVGHVVQTVYTYLPVGANAIGSTVSYANEFQGPSTPFRLRVYNPWRVGSNGVAQTRNVGFDFSSVHFEKLTASFKVEDWAENDLEGFASEDLLTFTSQVFKAYIGE